MKSNVDLTDNMIFSRSNRSFEDISFLIKNSISGKYPWSKWIISVNRESDLYIDSQRDKIIAVGNRHDREKVLEYRDMDSIDICDCCGSSLINYPWDRTYGICKKCNEYWENQEINKRKKYKWVFKPEQESRNVFRPILDKA